MIILGIETSCDETALALLEVDTSKSDPHFKVLAHEVLSQTIHAQFGGVFPMMAKREHGKNLIPLFEKVLTSAELLKTIPKDNQNYSNILQNIGIILEREKELREDFIQFIPTIAKPPIDMIAVTTGPGLEPALWVGINFAQALGNVWNIPIHAVNHMEGHVFAALMSHEETPMTKKKIPNPEGKKLSSFHNPDSKFQILPISFPALALLISGGHTELTLIKSFQHYSIVGETRDDACGEAFDKIARILGLPYPGGPAISKLAEKARQEGIIPKYPLPRPMIKSGDFDFSFAGLKTAALYSVKKIGILTDEDRSMLSLETENAITEVLTQKVRKAIDHFSAQTLIVAGGVIANTNIRSAFETLSKEKSVTLFIPHNNLSTDNALMIAIAGFFQPRTTDNRTLKASGTLRLETVENA